MKNISKYNSSIINILFLIFPLSLMLGNLFINLNVVFFSIFALIFYNKKLINFKINLLDKIILIFFLYTLVVLVINFSESYLHGESFSRIIINKNLLFFRYLVLYLTIRALVSQNILQLDWFSLACAICATFVCFDILFQFFFDKDIFGLVPISGRHYSGIFGEELVAGGYLQKFALFTFFLPLILKKKKSLKILIQFILIFYFVFGIILSGNRMPLILFVLSIFTYLLLDKNIRKYFFVFSIIICLFFSLIWNTSQNFKYNAGNLFSNGKIVVKTFFIKDLSKESETVWQRPYVTEFYCFKYIWQKNPIFGGGLRSYRTFSGGCNTHPHNYYFEILTDLGLVGLSIILFFIFMVLRKIFVKNNLQFKLNLHSLDSEVLPFFLIFLFEFFPLRTSGSFFTTNNSTIIFIVLAILVSKIFASTSKKNLYNN